VAAIRGCGAADVEGVGLATRAGTGCGSCKPEIAALLATEAV
jgi:assimilatory nitrate reductase catalytic subunit